MSDGLQQIALVNGVSRPTCSKTVFCSLSFCSSWSALSNAFSFSSFIACIFFLIASIVLTAILAAEAGCKSLRAEEDLVGSDGRTDAGKSDATTAVSVRRAASDSSAAEGRLQRRAWASERGRWMGRERAQQRGAKKPVCGRPCRPLHRL